jgi:hypothetical protein
MNVYRVRFTRPVDHEPDTIVVIADEYRVGSGQVRFYRDHQEICYFPMQSVMVWVEELDIEHTHRYRGQPMVYDQIDVWDPREVFEE